MVSELALKTVLGSFGISLSRSFEMILPQCEQ